MADTQVPGVLTSTRLWSEEVAIAEASDPEALAAKLHEPGYVFSNGRRFDSGQGAYADPAKPAP